jgi:hypothetical protein
MLTSPTPHHRLNASGSVVARSLRVLTVVAAAAFAVMFAASPASALVTTVNDGATGPWLGGYPTWNTCYTANHSLQTAAPYVGRTATYPNSTQTIQAIPRLDVSADGGRTWSTYRWGSWSTAVARPGTQANFPAQTFSNLPVGYTYRIAMWFYWSVGSTKVGQVLDILNTNGEYSTKPGTNDYGYANGGGCYLQNPLNNTENNPYVITYG